MQKVNTHILVAAAVLIAGGAAFFERGTSQHVAVAAPIEAEATEPAVPFAESTPSPAPAESTPNPHMASGPRADTIAIGKVARAPGERGYTIADLFEKKAMLVGKPVRVRAVVVKSLEGILERTFVHVRDGSGDAKAGTNELVITSEATPKVGDSVLFEGTLARDKDFGFGYRYPVLIENARLLAE
jgi:hypothetical protein